MPTSARHRRRASADIKCRDRRPDGPFPCRISAVQDPSAPAGVYSRPTINKQLPPKIVGAAIGRPLRVRLWSVTIRTSNARPCARRISAAQDRTAPAGVYSRRQLCYNALGCRRLPRRCAPGNDTEDGGAFYDQNLIRLPRQYLPQPYGRVYFKGYGKKGRAASRF